MFNFDSRNPFPLFAPSEYSYTEAKSHAEKVDEWLGYNFQAAEDSIKPTGNSSVQNWKSLPVQSMQTPYLEIRSMLSELSPQPGESIVDLGCAYGRMAHVVGAHYPDVQFTGFELESERVFEGQRTLRPYTYKNVNLKVQDLCADDFTLPHANYYFIYDYGTLRAISQTLNDIRLISQNKSVAVIGRGRAARHLIHTHPWLVEINPPRHFEMFSIYYS